MDYDPILQEVHAMKDQFAKECNYNIDEMCNRLREAEKEHPERIVDLNQMKDKVKSNL